MKEIELAIWQEACWYDLMAQIRENNQNPQRRSLEVTNMRTDDEKMTNVRTPLSQLGGNQRLRLCFLK
jgi:hypothetical protein